MNKKVGVWVVLILTSLALVIPSVAILYNLIFVEKTQSVVVNSDDVKISIETASPDISLVEVETEAEILAPVVTQ